MKLYQLLAKVYAQPLDMDADVLIFVSAQDSDDVDAYFEPGDISSFKNVDNPEDHGYIYINVGEVQSVG